MNTFRGVARVALIATAVIWAGTGVARAQWDPYPWPKNLPRTPDGKADLNAPARKTADGKPDFSGFWMPRDVAKYLLNLAVDMKDGAPLTPWGEEVYKERIANNGKDHP